MSSQDAAATRLSITPPAGEDELRACARMMCSSEPWITLGRSFETSLAILRDPTREVFLARDGNGVAGF
ncbi:MAG TPA: hypothetical protein VFH26_09455, partial [Gemmatimonadales bacterium]|nr:hypothetical protein [Gemmatimonadales bacterium]